MKIFKTTICYCLFKRTETGNYWYLRVWREATSENYVWQIGYDSGTGIPHQIGGVIEGKKAVELEMEYQECLPQNKMKSV